MSRIKKLLAVLLAALLLSAVIAGVRWYVQEYVIVDMQPYPRNERQLDLRDREISIAHYEKISMRLPETEILWNVPLAGGMYSNDVSEITVTGLTENDVLMMDYLTRLEKVDAENCKDYQFLLQLVQRRPEVEVTYAVTLGDQKVSGAVRRLSVDAVTDEQLELLRYLPNLKKLHIINPKASAEKLLNLRDSNPGFKITWEGEVYGKKITAGMEELDLSDTKVTDLKKLDREMSYFPEIERVFLGECGLDNEKLAAQRDLVRDKYKLVWTVSCGPKLKTRTDATTFMPVRERVYYFNDEEAYNLRYCEDMVCIDIGHMSIHNIDFVKYMPDLEYLILAHTQLQYIEPISTCKKLKFLELDWTPIRDLTPLQGCTALEDLNLGNTFADFSPVEKMTWLKNLWMVDCSTGARYKMTQALPQTKVMVTGAATVANGWRNLDNYYAMRDLLGMHYMSW